MRESLKDAPIEVKVLINMGIQLVVLIISILIYFIGRNFWNPTGFSLSNYWNLADGSFFENLQPLLVVGILIPFLMGQTDWFNSKAADEQEEGTLLRTSMKFKLGVSTFAGIVEELNYRGFTIYLAMVTIVIGNKFFALTFLLVCLVLIIGAWYLVMDISGNKLLSLAAGVLVLIGCIWMWNQFGSDPIYMLYRELYIPIYKWIFTDANLPIIVIVMVTALIIDIIGSIFLRRFISTYQPESTRSRIAVARFAQIMTPFTMLGSWVHTGIGFLLIYLMISETNPDVVLSGDFLLVAAITSSAFKFHQGHKYQGWKGAISSLFFAYYMQYVAFTVGLVYAIVVHFLYDATLFTSEEIAQRIKGSFRNRS